jgi:hypothetical protein
MFEHLMGGVARLLTRLKDEYLEQDGVLLMEDEAGAARKE